MRPGVYLADVDVVAAAVVTVTVRHGQGRSSGPYRCQFLEGPGLAAVTGAGGDGHTHPVTAQDGLAPGDRVLVAFLAGDPDRPVVLGRLAVP